MNLLLEDLTYNHSKRGKIQWHIDLLKGRNNLGYISKKLVNKKREEMRTQ